MRTCHVYRVQERDLKTFHEGLKQDTKLMKQSVDMLPKDLRKDVLRQRKEEKDVEQAEKVMNQRPLWLWRRAVWSDGQFHTSTSFTRWICVSCVNLNFHCP